MTVKNILGVLCQCKAELFGHGHFVGLGLKSEIRTRTLEIVTFLHLDPKLSVNEILTTF
jgi:hypothetical protein